METFKKKQTSFNTTQDLSQAETSERAWCSPKAVPAAVGWIKGAVWSVRLESSRDVLGYLTVLILCQVTAHKISLSPGHRGRNPDPGRTL